MNNSAEAASLRLWAPRWPWLVTAVMLLGAAGLTAWSTYLHWTPCRGSMFEGTWLDGNRYAPDKPFSDTPSPDSEQAFACDRRMDTGLPFPYPPEPSEQTPWASELGAAAMALAGLSWLVLALALRWPMRAKLIAAIPAIPPLIIATLSAAAAADSSRSPDAGLPGWLLLSGEALAVAVLLVVWLDRPELRSLQFLRLALVLWGVTAFGLIHTMFEYMIMIAYSSRNWDTPPGMGWITALVLAVSAVTTAALALAQKRPTTSRNDIDIELTRVN